jgi:hypothetical protein
MDARYPRRDVPWGNDDGSSSNSNDSPCSSWAASEVCRVDRLQREEELDIKRRAPSYH